MPKGKSALFTTGVLDDLRLETVCENAKCPNCMECFANKTATFMILGNVCTRSCGFCAVAGGKPEPVDPTEPGRLAEAADRLGLAHVVITSVTRDDLPDGGAEHFAQCIRAVRDRTGATVEVLVPDFLRKPRSVRRVVEAAPEVFNHNVETVPRLYRRVRGPKSEYGWTLELLRLAKAADPAVKIKSGLMLGLGETYQEVLDVLADLLDAGCGLLTIGQYLRPAENRYLPVVRYLEPAEFDRLGEAARRMGFSDVASAPFVRSSYQAHRMVQPLTP